MAEHNILGAKGEQLAKDFLIDQGYTILHENWRWKHKEVDIICQKDKWLIFVEVKTRSTSAQTISDTITPNKQGFLIEAANQYIEEYNIDLNVRFDVVVIYVFQNKVKINHIEEAFIPEID